MERKLEEDILRRIFFISEKVIVFDGIEDVFQHVLNTAVQLTKAEAATIRIFDIDTGMIKIVGGSGLSNGFLSQQPLKFGEGIVGKVIKEGTPFSTSDVKKVDYYVHKELAELEGVRALLCVPLRAKDATTGCITVYRKTKEGFTDVDVLLLNIFATQAVEAIEKTKLIEALKIQATIDALTNIYNRGSLMKRLEEEIERAGRHGNAFSILFIDIDEFKGFNDRHGHLLGDKLLADFAGLLKQNCRKNDIVGRYGGEEFVIATPEIDKEGAYALAMKLKNVINAHKFLGSEGDVTGISFSAGIASIPQDGDVLGDLLQRADDAMYRAKRNGKNRVEM
ncbi:MAG: diguanylate cyclase [Thermodesulfobacteriota bacterium]